MTVLISTKRGFINAVLEPQFQEAITGYMATLQFSDYDDVRMLTNDLRGDILYDRTNSMFPFKGFIHLDDLASHFNCKNFWSRLQTNKVDFTETPVAYYWRVYYTGENQEEGEVVDSETYFGHCLASDARYIRWSFEALPDVVQLYPIFTLPAELRETCDATRRHSVSGFHSAKS